MKICKLDFASALKIHSSTSDLHVLENLDLQRGPNSCSSKRAGNISIYLLSFACIE